MPAYQDEDNSDLSYVEQFYELFGEPDKDTGDNLVFVCPKCFHKALSCSKAKGIYHCFYCNYGKGQKLYSKVQPREVVEASIDFEAHQQIAKAIVRASLDIPKFFRSFYTERGISNPEHFNLGMVPNGVLNIVSRNGYPAHMLMASGFFYLNNLTQKLEPKSVIEPGRFVIPYYNFNNIVSLKTRFNPNYPVDRSDIRYLNPSGSKLSQKIFFMKKTCEDCIITEGELKAISTECQFSINCASIPGFNTYKHCIDQIYSLCQLFRRVYISLDSSNIESCTSLVNAAVTIYESMLEKGVDNICIAFPQKNEESKESKIDDYFLESSIKEIDLFLEYFWNTRQKTYGYCKKLQNGSRDRTHYNKVFSVLY